jgi:hypothetical protein
MNVKLDVELEDNLKGNQRGNLIFELDNTI